MERKRAAVIAGSISAVTMSAVLAVGATFGLFDLAGASSTSSSEGPGSFDPVSATSGDTSASTVPTSVVPTEQTVIVDVPVPAPAPSSPVAPTGTATPVAPSTSTAIAPSTTSTTFDDHGGDDDDHDDDSSGRGRGRGRGGDDDELEPDDD